MISETDRIDVLAARAKGYHTRRLAKLFPHLTENEISKILQDAGVRKTSSATRRRATGTILKGALYDDGYN